MKMKMLSPTETQLYAKIEKAVSFIRQLDGAVVALSAGVDSSLVAVLAKRALGNRVVAATAVSESLPPGELDAARATAREIGVEHVVVQTDELRNPDYSSNPSNRCYYCKETLYDELQRVAEHLGFEEILDGTHLDDLKDDRPGLEAAREAGVKSPLLIAGFAKKDVRETARLLGLSTWDKPAMPCLSSRIPHGEEVTAEKLSQVGRAELFIKSLTGVRELRVRSQNGLARIEVAPGERHLFFKDQVMDLVDSELRKIGFASVALDLRGYRKKAGEVEPHDPLVLPVITR